MSTRLMATGWLRVKSRTANTRQVMEAVFESLKASVPAVWPVCRVPPVASPSPAPLSPRPLLKKNNNKAKTGSKLSAARLPAHAGQLHARRKHERHPPDLKMWANTDRDRQIIVAAGWSAAESDVGRTYAWTWVRTRVAMVLCGEGASTWWHGIIGQGVEARSGRETDGGRGAFFSLYVYLIYTF